MSKKTRDNENKMSEYTWYKKISKHPTKKKIIQDQIDNFMFYIENEEYIKFNKYKDELFEFCDLIHNQGHLTHLDEEYQNFFKGLNKYLKNKTKTRAIAR